jgi:hypothetical protein
MGIVRQRCNRAAVRRHHRPFVRVRDGRNPARRSIGSFVRLTAERSAAGSVCRQFVSLTHRRELVEPFRRRTGVAQDRAEAGGALPMFRAIDRMSPLSGPASIAAVTAIAILVLLLAFVAFQPPPIAAPVSGPSKPGLYTNGGVDLECGGGAECGPDNPAVRVAPSPVIGPKILP